MDNKLAFELCELLNSKQCTMEQICDKYHTQSFKFMKYIEITTRNTDHNMWQWIVLMRIEKYLRDTEWKENGVNGYINHTINFSDYEKYLMDLDTIPVSLLKSRKFDRNSYIPEKLMDKILDSIDDLDEPKLKSDLLLIECCTERFLKFALKECPIYDKSMVSIDFDYFSVNLAELIRNGYLDNLDVSYTELVHRNSKIDYVDLMNELINLEKVNSEFAYKAFCNLSERILTYVNVKDIPKEFLARGLAYDERPSNLINKLFLFDDEDLIDRYFDCITNELLRFKSREQFDKYRDRLFKHCLKIKRCPSIVIDNKGDYSLFTDYLISMYLKGKLNDVYPMMLNSMTREQLDRVHGIIPKGLSREIDRYRISSDVNALDNMPEIDF